MQGKRQLIIQTSYHLLKRGIPAVVCDKTAAKLGVLKPSEIMITDSTWHYSGGVCC